MPTSPSLPPMNAHYKCVSPYNIHGESMDGVKSFLFTELNQSSLLFSPVLDKTLYLSPLVSLVFLLVQPIAQQDQFIACFHANATRFCHTFRLNAALVTSHETALYTPLSVLEFRTGSVHAIARTHAVLNNYTDSVEQNNVTIVHGYRLWECITMITCITSKL